MIEQPLFPPAAATVAAERPVRSNDAMAWNNDGDAVLTVDPADGSDGRGRAHGSRHVSVAACFPVGNAAQRAPGFQLKVRTLQTERDREFASVSREIFRQLLTRLAQKRMIARDDG